MSLFRNLCLTSVWMIGVHLCAAESPLESFRDGDIDRAITALSAIPDTSARNGMAVLAIDVLPKTLVLTPAQTLGILCALSTPLSVQQEKILMEKLKAGMVTLSDAGLLAEVLRGAGPYGGPTTEGRKRAYDLFGRAQLMEMQAPFMSGWREDLKAKKWNFVRGPLAFLQARAAASGRAQNRLELWECLSSILTDSAMPADLRTTALNAFQPLLSTLPDTLTDSVLDGMFAKGADASKLCNSDYSQFSSRALQSVTSTIPADEWVSRWHTLQRLADRICAMPENIPGWTPNDRKMFLRRCGQLWIDACRKQISAHQERQRRLRQRYYGREDNTSGFELSAESADILLSTVPSGKFAESLAQQGLTQQLEDVQTDLCIIADRYVEVADRIAAAVKKGRSASQASTQANSLLDKMSASMNPNNISSDNNSNRPDMLRNVISMTRLRTKNNIAQFRAVLSRLREANIEPSADKRLSVFEAIHSRAEIYNEPDLIFTFGSPADMDETTLFKLATHLSQKLGAEWQEPKTQLDMLTKRTPKETEILALQGYMMLDSMLEAAQNGIAGRKFLAHALRGSTLYQCAEYLRKLKAPEAEIERKRTLGLQCFERAAARYNELVSELYEPQYSTVIYELWFDAAMLAGAGKYNVKDRPNIMAIRQTLFKMPEDIAWKHLNKLADKLAASAQKQSGRVRPVYLLSALKVTEGTREANAFKRRLDYYASLMDEAKLIVEPDMVNGKTPSDAVGLRVYLRHTPELSRESGGFARYLNPASNPNNYLFASMMGLPGNDPSESVANRENLEKTFSESLEKNFDILSMGFCNMQSVPVLLPDGWLSQPLAYILAKPKSDTLDRIPEVKIELEFADEGKVVVLPVESAPVSVRLTPPAEQAVPPDAEVTARANFRDLNKGRALFEVSAKASGLIGGFETLFEKPDFEGFKVRDREDGGPQVAEVSANSQGMKVSFERTWIFHLEPENPDHLPLKFNFPVPKGKFKLSNLATHDVNYQTCSTFAVVRESQTSLETLSATELFGVTLQNWLLGTGSAAVVLLIVLAFAIRLRRRQTVSDILPVPPAHETPLSVLRYLFFLRESGVLSEPERETLDSDIAALERAAFASDGGGGDYHAVLNRWKKTRAA